MLYHSAVVTVAPRAPLQIRQVPTVAPSEGEVRIRVEWTASTPLDLHQADGGLLVKHPQVLGDGLVGTVVEIGEGVQRIKAGDKVPTNFAPEAAVTVPNNVVTVFHTINTELGIQLLWPKPSDYEPPHADAPFLVWGGSSSVGSYALQILKYYGYRNLFTTASKRHHERLKSFGARYTFDYNDSSVAEAIRVAAAESCQRGASHSPLIPFIIDCIGSQSHSLSPLSDIAHTGSKVAVMLPVIVRDATKDIPPEYSMDVQAAAHWRDGVEVTGVRTHFYLENEFFAVHLQPDILPAVLSQGIVKPNDYRIVQGPTLLARAQAALEALRRKEVSGERLVWRIADE
ncbi:hypothetical protein W97_08927 [Coniosporium apollinis CBS 100218]|uniref:Alcohol dehydrogenase-like N-terminal domain-containing protein n=1 Tax=Coniosporium apollinis (strain CBS 100218) TaxID=1168221 RepID=R7Z670_CONA1|nr:uncharacterized protein W97_08927 [Coniosporium apollinis CBS 100218]EON69675.1 hypothetical protein W97_08927 [Coniosporium apollinis CBS 100218]